MKKQWAWSLVFVLLLSFLPRPGLAAPPPQGEDLQAKALAISQEGDSYLQGGKYKAAIERYEEARLIYEEIGDTESEQTMLNNIGASYRHLGQYKLALEYYERVITIAEGRDDDLGKAKTLSNMGVVYHNMGFYEQALEAYLMSLATARARGEKKTEAILLNNLGETYHELGQYEQAEHYHQEALAIARQIREGSIESAALNNLGLVNYDQERYKEALDHYERAIKVAEQSGFWEVEISALNNMWLVYESLGQHEQALPHYERVLEIAEQQGHRQLEGVVLNNISTVYALLGRYEEASIYLQRALEIWEETGDLRGKATTLSNIGFLYRLQGDSEQAILYYQQAVELAESVESRISVGDLKLELGWPYRNNYHHLVDLLWNESRFEEAFNYVERGRARVFLDQLAGGAVDFRAGIDSDLVTRERELRSELAAIRSQFAFLQSSPNNELYKDVMTVLQDELTAMEADYVQLLTEIQLQSPEVASLVSVDVASLAEIQNLLDEDTTLLEYFVTDERTLAFVIAQKTFETAVLNVSREDLEEAIIAFRGSANHDNPYPDSLKQLHTWLIAPLGDKLKTSKIGIVPHGVLHYFPFAALTDGEGYFADDFTLFNLPSASTLRFLLEKRKADIGDILILGNPSASLSDLPSAEQEVNAISQLYGTSPLVGDAATESALLARATEAGILHLATHGEYNSSNPLFSALYFAADSQNDGRLEVHEVYNLDLTKITDLVVLSACQTNVGTVSTGDDVVALNRAFMYAGAPTVIASLWKVEDRSTALLMEQFYAFRRSGASKAEALRQAQIKLRELHPEYFHPHYWAAFVLSGDAGSEDTMQTTARPKVNEVPAWISGAGALLLLGICCLGLMGLLAVGFIWQRRRKKVVP